MPYQHIEEIQSRKGEKIAMFLTIENAVGLVLGALPAYLISTAMPLILRIVIVGAASLLGVIATLDVGGMSLAGRIAWRVRGALRLRFGSATIAPEQLTGGAAVRRDRPLAVGGPVQLRDAIHPAYRVQRPDRQSIAPVINEESHAHPEAA